MARQYVLRKGYLNDTAIRQYGGIAGSGFINETSLNSATVTGVSATGEVGNVVAQVSLTNILFAQIMM